MTQAYSDPARESDPHALPDVEVFYVPESEAVDWDWQDMGAGAEGWYWWTCFPGCLPDGDPSGPYGTEAEALADAQDIG